MDFSGKISIHTGKDRESVQHRNCQELHCPQIKTNLPLEPGCQTDQSGSELCIFAITVQWKQGAGEEIRTLNILLGKQTLCR